MDETETLANIFDKLSYFYNLGAGKKESGAGELWRIYDGLAELFGKRSDFDIPEEEVKVLYNQIKNGEPV